MTIKVGDKIPSVTLKHLTDSGMQEISTDEVFSGKKVAMFGVPGAFTPTCSAKHLPGFVAKANALKYKGIDSIVCLSVNDPFVMLAWGKDQRVGDAVTMLPDGNGALTKALGLEVELSGAGLGTRCRRFALVADDGVVTKLFVEKNPGEFEVSGAEAVLEAL